jgi:hypothetical protein
MALFIMKTVDERFCGGMVKTLALYSKGQRFEPQRRRFFTPTQWVPGCYLGAQSVPTSQFV